MKSVLLCFGLLGMKMLVAGIFVGRAGFEVCVLDSETGMPLSGVKIEGSFLNYSRGWGIAAKNNDVDAVTDVNGMATLSGNTEKGVGGYRICNNPGYYSVYWIEVAFDRRSPLHLGRWQPGDIVSTARLDRVVNPIPLWVTKARRLRARENVVSFAETGDVVSYDLLKNEWLPPLGNGSVADIRFLCKRTVLGAEAYDYPTETRTNVFYRHDVEVGFSGVGNGMIEVVPPKQAGIKLRIAPESGYEPIYNCWESRVSRTERRDSFNEDRCFYFRIRTKLDEDGKIESAIYGKIYGDFKLLERGDGSIVFGYYLNPTPNDRNLEWDMKHNLCPKPRRIGPERP